MILMLALFALVFWMWMFGYCMRHEKKAYDKSIWLAIMFLINVGGTFAYLVLRYRTNRKRASLAAGNQSSRNDSYPSLICPWCNRLSELAEVEAQDGSMTYPSYRICPDCFGKLNNKGNL